MNQLLFFSQFCVHISQKTGLFFFLTKYRQKKVHSLGWQLQFPEWTDVWDVVVCDSRGPEQINLEEPLRPLFLLRPCVISMVLGSASLCVADHVGYLFICSNLCLGSPVKSNIGCKSHWVNSNHNKALSPSAYTCTHMYTHTCWPRWFCF